MRRVAFVDNYQAAKDFVSGDKVQKPEQRGYWLLPYVGTVVYSNPETGIVQVQWPWGIEQELPTEIIRVSNEIGMQPNTALDQFYSNWESARMINDPETLKEDKKWRKSLSSRVASRPERIEAIISLYETRTIPIYKMACKAMYDGLDELQAYRSIANRASYFFGTDEIVRTVSNLYKFASYQGMKSKFIVARSYIQLLKSTIETLKVLKDELKDIASSSSSSEIDDVEEISDDLIEIVSVHRQAGFGDFMNSMKSWWGDFKEGYEERKEIKVPDNLEFTDNQKFFGMVGDIHKKLSDVIQNPTSSSVSKLNSEIDSVLEYGSKLVEDVESLPELARAKVEDMKPSKDSSGGSKPSGKKPSGKKPSGKKPNPPSRKKEEFKFNVEDEGRSDEERIKDLEDPMIGIHINQYTSLIQDNLDNPKKVLSFLKDLYEKVGPILASNVRIPSRNRVIIQKTLLPLATRLAFESEYRKDLMPIVYEATERLNRLGDIAV